MRAHTTVVCACSESVLLVVHGHCPGTGPRMPMRHSIGQPAGQDNMGDDDVVQEDGVCPVPCGLAVPAAIPDARQRRLDKPLRSGCEHARADIVDQLGRHVTGCQALHQHVVAANFLVQGERQKTNESLRKDTLIQ